MTRIFADYELESPVSLERAAATIAGEQSSGTFVRLPNETDDLRSRSGATVEQIVVEDVRKTPSLPCRLDSDRFERGRIRLSWPIETMGPSLPNLLATVAGNLFELAEVSALRLLDVTFPDAFATANPGPAFGVAGTRALTGVDTGPMIGTIIKPSVGLNPTQTADLVADLVRGGIDFIKDDELQANGPACPLEERVQAVMRVVNRDADRTGKKAMVAFNITGDIDEMKRGHDIVRDAGGTCIMVSMHCVGLAGMLALRRHSDLPIHAHRAGWGLYSRSPDIGISYVAWQKFWRLAGADHLHVNGLSNKFSEPDDSVQASARAVLSPLFENGQGLEAMPVFSSGQTALQLPGSIAAAGSQDFLICAGGGIMGHPGGVAGGVESMRQAADAVASGQSLGDYAQDHPALAKALETFGGRVG
ncbi:ribulose-bisphosphate carboxylase large subunit family protein [Marimonas arenosa]|uniref:Ribulose-bisphosphate carboxylase large subunit family protein n=1 Tax=Marimonas arenosa TaxID=1795305 RepID=A0AAE3WC87_9RHOB|nr:ribulose-bisphosphate carboxylase large subunit family protein [Marimonas arenosa]MDQ2088978.1 ribulose-bisphosphate carboxylase large subunit family protein [Marimonas arenosa]